MQPVAYGVAVAVQLPCRGGGVPAAFEPGQQCSQQDVPLVLGDIDDLAKQPVHHPA